MKREEQHHGAAGGIGKAVAGGGFASSDVPVFHWLHGSSHVQWLLHLLLSLLLFSCVKAQQTEGDRCNTQFDEVGICRPFAQCQRAKEQFAQGIRPKICSFNLNTPIICCVSGAAPTPTKKPRPNNPTGSQVPRPTQGSGSRPRKMISERKCEEYSQMVTEHVVALPLVVDPNPVSFAVENCMFTGLELIVGGERTKPGEFPHMAAIGFRQSNSPGFDWDCGGSLISERFVLTAAHCTSNSKGPPVAVRIGQLSLRRDEPDGDLFHPPESSRSKNSVSSGDYMIDKVIRHPAYRPPAKYNDLALLRLEKPVKPFTSLVRPACLYTDSTFKVNRTTATGWGRIDFAESPSDVLLKVGLQIIDTGICNQLYASDKSTKKLSQGILPSMMCAGELAGGKDTCQGDSGGPIQIQSSSNRCIHYVIGVTSFGKFCAAANSPGVYTRVSYYVPWIESIVWPSG